MELKKEIKFKKQTKIESEMIEFAIRHADNRLWISIECMIANKVVENAFKVELRKKEIMKVCNNICEEIDSIFDINKNRDMLIDIINTTSKGEKKLGLITFSMVSYKGVDRSGNRIESEPQILIKANKTQLHYFYINNEFSRLVNYIYDNKQKLMDLGSALYWAGNEAYHRYEKSLITR